MGQYTFTKKRDPDNRFDTTEVMFNVDTVSLSELVESFQDFLKACGYELGDCDLDLIERDSVETNSKA